MKKLLISFVILCFVFSFGVNSIFLEKASAASPARIESDMTTSIPKGAVIDKTEVTTVYFDKSGVSSATTPDTRVMPEWGTPYYYIVNTTSYDRPDLTPIAETSGGPGPGTVSLSQAGSISNSWSADVGVTAQVVSAGVGFSVTGTVTRTFAYTAQVASGQHATIDAYAIQRICNYEVWYNPLVGNAYLAGYGWAMTCIGVDYRVTYWH